MSIARPIPTRLIATLALALAALSFPAGARAQVLRTDLPAQAQGLEVVEHLGDTLPMDASFTDDARREVKVGDYFGAGNTKPAIIALVYYRCPVVCSVVMAKLVESLNQVDYSAGKDFNVLLFSVKDEETVIDAAGAKARFVDGYTRAKTDPSARDGWHFHVGKPEDNKKLADAIGFTFKREVNGEYAHPVAIFVVTPQGKISRYMYGFDYRPETVKMALLEASNGTIAKSIGERFLPFCYRYDPAAGTYTLQAFKLMRIGGVVMMVLVFGLVLALRIHEGVRRRRLRLEHEHAGSPVQAPGQGADESGSKT